MVLKSNNLSAGSRGYYWSSSLNTGNPRCAWYFYFGSDSYGMGNFNRGYGPSVQLVRSFGQN